MVAYTIVLKFPLDALKYSFHRAMTCVCFAFPHNSLADTRQDGYCFAAFAVFFNSQSLSLYPGDNVLVKPSYVNISETTVLVLLGLQRRNVQELCPFGPSAIIFSLLLYLFSSQ